MTTPCPSFELTDADGNTTLVDEIGLAGLGLSDAEIPDVLEQLAAGTLSVRGFVTEIDLAIVFQVTKLL